MKKSIFFVVLSTIQIFIISSSFAEPIKGSGCPTEYFLVKDLAEAYQAKTGQVIMPGRNNNKISLNLLSQGRIDFAFCCEHHCIVAKSLGLEPAVYKNWVSLPVAMDPVIIVAHKDIPVESLTLHQLRDIYFGNVVNWQKLGGPQLPIKPVAPADSEESGVATVFREQTLKKTGTTDWPNLSYNSNVTLFSREDSQMYESTPARLVFHVRKNPGSIGYFGSGNYKNQVGKILKIDGIEPSRGNILTGAYPLSAKYYLVYDRQKMDKIKNFLDFVQSSEGQKIINMNFIGTDSPAEGCNPVQKGSL